MAGSNLIGNLAVNLSMETAAFQRGATIAEKRTETMKSRMGGMAKSVAGMGMALGAGMVVAGITSAVQSAFELGSSLSEASEKMGVTVEGLQRLRVAARETGVSNEQLDSAMTKLNKSLGELQLGEAAATKAYAQIGLSADQLKGKKPDEALRLIADALNKIPDPQQRIAIGSELMGRGFAQLIPMISGGSEALDKYAEQSKKSGEVSDENAKKLDELADTWEGMKVSVGVATANIIASTASMFGKVNQWLVGLETSTKAFDAAVANMARNAVQWVNNMVSGIGEAITGRLGKIWTGAKERIADIKQGFKDLYIAVVGNSYIPDMVAGIAQEMARLGQVMVDPALSATDKVGAAFQSLGNLIGQIFGGKTGSKIGGILGAIGSAFGAIAAARQPSLAGSTVGGIAGSPSFASASNDNWGTRVVVDTSPLLTAKIVQGDARAAVSGASGGMAGIYRAQRSKFP